MEYYSDQVQGPSPRLTEKIDALAWTGLTAIINGRLSDEAFAKHFPTRCRCGEIVGSEVDNINGLMLAEVKLGLPIDRAWGTPDTLQALDCLQFCYQRVAKVTEDRNNFYGHRHLEFDEEAGRDQFRRDVNRVLARTGIAYELDDDGRVRRLVPEVFEPVINTTFKTGEPKLDELLESAMQGFLKPTVSERKDALD